MADYDDDDQQMTAGERELLANIRKAGFDPSVIAEKVSQASQRRASTPPPQYVTLEEARKMAKQEADQARADTKQQIEEMRHAAASKDLTAMIEDSINRAGGVPKRGDHRRLVLSKTMSALAARKDTDSMTEEDFQNFLDAKVVETVEAIKKDAASLVGVEVKSEKDAGKKDSAAEEDKKVTAADRMGEAPADQPPPKSEAGMKPRDFSRVDESNLDDAYGRLDVNWGSDADIQREMHRDAVNLMQSEESASS
jgi:hypothetical protein